MRNITGLAMSIDYTDDMMGDKGIATFSRLGEISTVTSLYKGNRGGKKCQVQAYQVWCILWYSAYIELSAKSMTIRNDRFSKPILRARAP